MFPSDGNQSDFPPAGLREAGLRCGMSLEMGLEVGWDVRFSGMVTVSMRLAQIKGQKKTNNNKNLTLHPGSVVRTDKWIEKQQQKPHALTGSVVRTDKGIKNKIK